jgi:hypothetical protein
MAQGQTWGKVRRRVKRMGDKHEGVVHPLLSSALIVILVGLTIALAIYTFQVK